MNIDILNQLDLHDVGVDKIELDFISHKVSIFIERYNENNNDYYKTSLLFYNVQNLYFNGLMGNLTDIEIYNHDCNNISEILNNIIFTFISPKHDQDFISISCQLKFEFSFFEIK